MIENSSLWVVSDVDGTLMDHSYDLTPAKETIKTLQKLSIPVILCTSKTAAEVKIIRKDLNLTDPYIVENGAAIYGESLKKVNGEIILGKKYEFLEEILNLISKEIASSTSCGSSESIIYVFKLVKSFKYLRYQLWCRLY